MTDAPRPGETRPAAPATYTGSPYADPHGTPGAYYAPVAAPPTNTLAILALVFSFFLAIGAVICGHLAIGQIRRTGEGGRGLAVAGLVIGYIHIGLWVLLIAFYVVVVLLLGAGALFAWATVPDQH